MDHLLVNKSLAALLIAGIAFFLSGTLGMVLVHPHRLERSVLNIQVAEPSHGKEVAAPVELPPIAPLLAKADVVAGEATSKKLCSQCHTFTDGGKNGVGPNVYGVVGATRATGSFNYSNALKGVAGSWSFDDLNKWLAKPTAFAPGTRMAFAGIKNEQQRADVIAYLRSLSKSPVPLPAQ